MRPYDRRLSQQARSARVYLSLATALGLVSVALVIAQAALLASGISTVFAGGRLATTTAVALAAVVVTRAGVAWAQELTAHRCSAGAKSELRERLLAHVLRLGPAWLHGERASEVATLATRGLDALDGYFARYLPQLLLAALVPVAVLAWIVPVDTTAAITIAVTLPLIPLFLALVGRRTEQLNQRQLAALSRLAHHLMEVIAGLPTLAVFGRAKAQVRAVRELTDNQRRLTMRTLRLAFLSSLVLELLATLSVALVAVTVGLRVVGGSLDLHTSLLVLILAPEAYLPLRRLGAEYHASAEGLAAAQRVLDILDTPVPAQGSRTSLPESRHAPLILEHLTVAYDGRPGPAVADFSLRLEPGTTVALVGPSGCGKSTVVNAVLGFVPAASGRVLLGEGSDAVDAREVEPDVWRSRIAYVSQRPYLFAGTVAQNIALGTPDAPEPQLRGAADAAGLAGMELSTVVGEGGAGLSAGQRQRVALARAFLREAPVLVLDEPTANLDEATEAALVSSIRELAMGRAVLLVAHRPALLAIADRVVRLAAPEPDAPRVLAVAA